MVAEDLVNNLRNELAEARQALKDSKELFDEFHEESKLLEAELEREAEDLRIKHATLAKEHELLKRKFSDLQSQTNKDASAMQKELDALRASDKSQRETITTLEIQNEELEQVSRNATASAESVKEHYSQLLERAALLEQELENRSELQDDNQRLKDDVRDLTSELNVLKLRVTSERESRKSDDLHRKKSASDIEDIPSATREVHEKFMKAALDQAQEAYDVGEVPVGCVFVHNGEIIGRGRNRTNESLNGTRHAEFEAVDQILLSHPPTVFPQTDLYVTVEPCVMCAGALKILGVRKVYFGCGNDKFGGCGTVFEINQDECSPGTAYPAESGFFKEEAIMMLRRFYVRENNHAPVPKRKTNRTLKSDII